MKLTQLLFLSIFLSSLGQGALSSCVWSEGYYKNDQGNVEFAFYNTCKKNFAISLCIKEYVSPTSDETKFSRLSGMINSRNILKLSAGPWNDWIDYRWDWGQEVECPYRED